MKIKSYHPSVEVYVAVTGYGGAVSYYDLTDDVTSCTVTRNVEAPSTFRATFQNPGGKYDNLFTPMDRIVIRAVKDEYAYPLIAGYINTVDKWRLFDRDFAMSGTDVLYKLRKMYFDPGLVYNSQLFAGSRGGSAVWGGYADDIYKWLVDIAGWPSGRISIGPLSQNVMNWAQSIYAKQLKDIGSIEELDKQFRELLISTGAVTSVAGDGEVVGGGGGVEDITGDPMNGAPKVVSATGGLSAQKRQTILNAGYAILGTRYVLGGNDPYGGIDCSGFTKYCYSKVGITLNRTARTQQLTPGFVRVSRENLQPGDIIGWIGRFSANGGDHVALYAGNNTMIHSSTTRQYYGVQVGSLAGWPTVDYYGYVPG